MKQKEYLKSLLSNTYGGKTWYGKNIKKTLSDIPIGKALLRLQGSYNIVELVHHMIAWRRYAIDLIRTQQHQNVPDHVNFPVIEVMMQDEWTDLLITFSETQEQLMDLLPNLTVDLDQEVEGKPYTYFQVLEGVAHHDIYHAGQLNLLAKFL